jgi:hypothetical protein
LASTESFDADPLRYRDKRPRAEVNSGPAATKREAGS